MAYTALYRQWRPQTFAELIGQDHVGRTIKNAVAHNRIAHAYLFCGSRGTGKTSAAQILAKAVNCLDPQNGEPCNQCTSCCSINDKMSLDVLEIDAASNRGIDEIRELKEKIKFAASQNKYKVYIIDEVHMLTNEAFNALLKTLEEPPAHVIFVLATTEPNKVPLTILSRCQRFDFHRISNQDIVERLRFILEERQASYSEEALYLIARAAEGGLRDALSILDQCLTYCEGTITAEIVQNILGIVGDAALEQLTLQLAAGNEYESLKLLAQLADQGKDLKAFIKSSSEYLRSLLFCRLAADKQSLLRDLGTEKVARLQQLAADFTGQELIAMLDVFAEAEKNSRFNNQSRLLLEMAIIKACQIKKPGWQPDAAGGKTVAVNNVSQAAAATDNELQLTVSQLLRRLDFLEQQVKQLQTAADTAVKQGTPAAAAASTGSPVQSGKKQGLPAVSEQQAEAEKILPAAANEPQVAEADQRLPAAELPEKKPQQPADKQRSAESDKRKAVLSLAEQQKLISRSSELWPQLLEAVGKQKRVLRAYLLEGRPKALRGLTLLVAFNQEHSFHRDNLEKPNNKIIVEQILRKVVDQRLSLRFVLEEEIAALLATQAPAMSAGAERCSLEQTPTTAPAAVGGISPAGEPAAERKASDKAKELFGADMVEIIDE